jgi:hypothetical protein
MLRAAEATLTDLTPGSRASAASTEARTAPCPPPAARRIRSRPVVRLATVARYKALGESVGPALLAGPGERRGLAKGGSFGGSASAMDTTRCCKTLRARGPWMHGEQVSHVVPPGSRDSGRWVPPDFLRQEHVTTACHGVRWLATALRRRSRAESGSKLPHSKGPAQQNSGAPRSVEVWRRYADRIAGTGIVPASPSTIGAPSGTAWRQSHRADFLINYAPERTRRGAEPWPRPRPLSPPSPND